ncbi:MAG: hypothetical protein SFV18_14720 [Bryobacteraceae bacterium]|nr:hypothetical protein [Bryobacteraceae bacterium]
MRGVLLLIAGAASSAAQGFPRNTITLGLGAAIPGQDLKGFFEPSVALGFNYGYRPHRNFQIDGGLDTVIQAARVNDFADTAFGSRRIRDYQLFIPFGGRVILPSAEDRVQLYAGGGGVWARYFESISQPSTNFQIDCPQCLSRSGFGYYALVGAKWRPSRWKGFWFGGSVRVVRVTTDGDPIGALVTRPTRDRWVTPSIEVGFSF